MLFIEDWVSKIHVFLVLELAGHRLIRARDRLKCATYLDQLAQQVAKNIPKPPPPFLPDGSLPVGCRVATLWSSPLVA